MAQAVPNSDLDGSYWAVAQTIPNMESRARDRLQDRLRFKTILPMWVRSRIVRGKRVPHEIVVFPGYLFFRVVNSWMPVLGLDNGLETFVVRVLMGNSGPGSKEPPHPARVSDEKIKEITDLMAAHGGYFPLNPHNFLSGQRVRVNNMQHSFYGLEGLYEGQPAHERARVLLDMLGRKVPTVFNERDLVAA